jgi:hypothetical protein
VKIKKYFVFDSPENNFQVYHFNAILFPGHLVPCLKLEPILYISYFLPIPSHEWDETLDGLASFDGLKREKYTKDIIHGKRKKKQGDLR